MNEKDILLSLAEVIRAELAPHAPLLTRLVVKEELPLDNPWDPGVSEVNLLLRAIMSAVGLAALDVFVELFDGDEKLRGLADTDKKRPPHQPAVWFDTLDDGLCYFGAEAGAIDDAHACVAACAEAVAEAAWAAWELDGDLPKEPKERARYADVTAVELGIGLLLLPRPPALSPGAVLHLLADLIKRSVDLDPAAVEVSLDPASRDLFLAMLPDD